MRLRTLIGVAVGALLVASLASAATAPPAAVPAPPAATPRAADGHPDLGGMWRRAAGGRAASFANISGGEGFTRNVTRDGDFENGELDAEVIVKSDQDMPQYKPEYWAQLHDLEEFAYRRPADPAYGCKNPGVVRLGMPAEIIDLPGKVILIYTGEHLWIREVPTDGRPLPKPDDYEATKIVGNSSGHWDGDTLVIETVDFPPDLIWYSSRGWMGSPEAKIVERFRRIGDALTLETTVDDPMFVQPWTPRPQRMVINRDPAPILPQPLPCQDHDGALLPPSN